MIPNEHSPYLENIPAYALGALDWDETASLEAHLQTCESCQTELTACQTVSESLLMAMPPAAPSAALRKRLQSRLPSAQKSPRTHLFMSMNWFTAAGLTSAVLLLFVNVFSVMQINSLELQQSQLMLQAQSNQTVLAMLSYPGTKALPITAQNITGTLLLDEDRNMAELIVWDLPQLPASQTYQAWLIDPQGDRTSAAIFHPESNGRFTSIALVSAGNLSNFTGVGVTVEPQGGSHRPTGPRLFRVDF
jgi:anti-sigma-K factor RskA